MNDNLMTLEEMREHEWWVSWSGGKDSTATILLMREYNIPIKEIIYVRMMYDNKIPATLPIMTDFVDETINKFEEWGYKVNVVKSLKTAKSITEGVYRRSESYDRNGKCYGISAFSKKWCKFSDIKTKTIQSIKSNYETESRYEMIGYAADETNRLHRLGGDKQSIMVTLGVTEDEAFKICKKNNMLSPLYNLGIARDGCWFCPNLKKIELEELKQNYPGLIKKIYNMICMCEYDIGELYKLNSVVKDFMDTRGFIPRPPDMGKPRKYINKIKVN